MMNPDNLLYVCECGGMPKSQTLRTRCLRCGGDKILIKPETEVMLDRIGQYNLVKSTIGNKFFDYVKSVGYDGIMFYGNNTIARARNIPSGLWWLKKFIGLSRLQLLGLEGMYYDVLTGLPISWQHVIGAISFGIVDFEYKTKKREGKSFNRDFQVKNTKKEKLIRRQIRKFVNIINGIYFGDIEMDDHIEEMDLVEELDCNEEIQLVTNKLGFTLDETPKLTERFTSLYEKELEKIVGKDIINGP